MERADVYRVGAVFVPGGLPTVTYDARSDLHLEERLRDYLDERHRILSVSGPTKCGKTVLLRSVIDNAVWLSGGEVASIDQFWAEIADELSVFTVEDRSETTDETADQKTGGSLNVGVLKGDRSGSESISTGRSSGQSRQRPVGAAARRALATNLRPLVIDDFHYISQALQLQIVRGVKDLVFNGLPVILASVPHRAYDAVRVEKEMTGRVEQFEIEFWSREELARIAERGFEVLNARQEDELVTRLTSETFASPHLMQDFCLQLCKDNDLRQTSEKPVTLRAPNWGQFFRSRGSATSKTAFDRLARGPRQRSDRKARQLTTGDTTDIYGAVLAAIAHTGPLTTLTYEQLRAALRQVLDEEPPQRHEVTRVLDEMVKIAREEIEGEPVLDYDLELSTLYIADPFFAYFLRWGRREDQGS